MGGELSHHFAGHLRGWWDMPSEVSIAGMDRESEPTVSELKRELAEAREQQATTRAILGAISNSRTEPHRAFREIAVSAARLCDGYNVGIFQLDGDCLRLIAHHGPIPGHGTLPLTRGLPPARAVLDRQTLHVADLQTETAEYPEGSEFARRLGFRAALAVPLMREGEAIGVITIRRTDARPFTDRQIDVLETFADQAVIAIENTRLFEAEQASKRELQESLEYQTATSDVLGVIAASPTDIQPVLKTLVESACRLCAAYDGIILLREGDRLQIKAHHGPIPTEIAKRTITRDWVNGRCVADRVQIHVLDVQAEAAEYPEGAAIAQRVGARTILSTPLMREGEAIGAIMIRRDEVRPFSDKQMGLLETFARQAVIAIENTRLFDAEQASKRELQESLEQQTATADVLKVISRSALDVQRVLEALVESAARLCNAQDAAIFQVFGDTLRLVAHHGQIATLGPIGQHTILVERGTMAARAVIDLRTIQVADMLAEGHEYPESRKRALQNGHRTALAVPLVHAGEAIGVILMRRGEVRPFVERQVELVNTFADQAVIAIENARLFEQVQSRTHELAKTVEDLEIASQHKSQFVANMSHELRTPLAAVLGYAELLQEGIYGTLPEKSLPILTRIRSNGNHLLSLINTVLDVSKIEAGQFKLNLAEYALGSIVETVMVATESLAATKKLAFKTDVAKELSHGLGDEQRLTQVLLNLVGNAIKFTDAGEVRITAGAANGHFTVSVSDTGPGIPPEECEHIFEKFRQVDSSNTRAKGGTGLGLAIAREIVEMHGGRIWVESRLGQGSTFRMELPVRAPISAGAA
jgi:signal transduction histidine kinase/putative methionine-R-sulfoxide reductase with GAF domain